MVSLIQWLERKKGSMDMYTIVEVIKDQLESKRFSEMENLIRVIESIRSGSDKVALFGLVRDLRDTCLVSLYERDVEYICGWVSEIDISPEALVLIIEKGPDIGDVLNFLYDEIEGGAVWMGETLVRMVRAEYGYGHKEEIHE
jgi:hypothetical protein